MKSKKVEAIDSETREVNINVQKQYAKSLQQQIKLLELENSYLRRNLEASSINVPTTSGVILSRGNKVSLNGRDWCRLPPFHPDITKVIEDRIHYYQDCLNYPTRMTTDTSKAEIDEAASVYVQDNAERTQRTCECYQSNAELLQNLEERNQVIRNLEVTLKEKLRTIEEQQERIKLLMQRLEKAEADRHTKQEGDMKSKRALMEEILELQRRLDDLTPALAAKEARIVQLVNERDDLTSKSRNLHEIVAQLQLDLREKEHVDSLYSEKIRSANEDIERARDEVLHLKSESFKWQQKEDELLGNLLTLRNQLKEAQSRHSNDKALHEKTSAENTKLLEENTRLLSEIARIELSREREREQLERDFEAKAHDEIVELRLNVKAHKTQIGILEERLEASIQRCEQLKKELEVYNTTEDAARCERLRIQKELDALQALSRSLSSENRSLREDKVLLAEKIETLENLIVSKENAIAEMEDILITKDKDRQEAMNSAMEELRKQTQREKSSKKSANLRFRSLEFKELSRRVKELSASLDHVDDLQTKIATSDSKKEHVPPSTEISGTYYRRLSSIPESMLSPRHASQKESSCSKCSVIDDVIEMTQKATKALVKK
ncbi:hypothetical protein DICVIV_12202 [Dictyocaulus viviparus]|uniref:Uncharacterized protein n=1 Tax=Dictyocaulus viviparus TaxID=29172 RepID=A0A0D8XDU6_DICVI|nr:hypothetical protein DICVIV_12202 [Dictyocaulus viviparus]